MPADNDQPIKAEALKGFQGRLTLFLFETERAAQLTPHVSRHQEARPKNAKQIIPLITETLSQELPGKGCRTKWPRYHQHESKRG